MNFIIVRCGVTTKGKPSLERGRLVCLSLTNQPSLKRGNRKAMLLRFRRMRKLDRVNFAHTFYIVQRGKTFLHISCPSSSSSLTLLTSFFVNWQKLGYKRKLTPIILFALSPPLYLYLYLYLYLWYCLQRAGGGQLVKVLLHKSPNNINQCIFIKSPRNILSKDQNAPKQSIESKMCTSYCTHNMATVKVGTLLIDILWTMDINQI